MRPARSQPRRPAKAKVKRLASKCRCGKLGYESEHTAMDAVISGRYSRAGVRVYQCDQSSLWHTTSKRQLPRHAKEPEMHTTPKGCTPDETALLAALRHLRHLRSEGVKGQELMEANNAAQQAFAKAGRP